MSLAANAGSGGTAGSAVDDFPVEDATAVSPVVPDALPGATLGHSVVALTRWFH